MLKKLISVCLFIIICKCTQAQDFSPELKNSYKRIVYLTEMKLYDSANYVIDSLELTFDDTDRSHYRIVFMLRYEIADRSGDCRTKKRLMLEGLQENQEYIAPDTLALSSTYNLIAIECKCLGEMEEAIVYFKKAIELDPRTQFLYSNMAGAYMALSQYKNALDALNYCTDSIDPSHPSAMIRKAKCLYELKNYEEARILLHPIIKIEKYAKDKLANHTLGDVYLALGNKSKACEHFKIAQLPDGSTFQNHPNNGDYRLSVHLQEMLELQLKIKQACN